MHAIATAGSKVDTDPTPTSGEERPAPGSQGQAHANTSAGPLVAVVSLCGGAGASTLAYLIARSAANGSEQPVLVCDTGGPTGGLAAYAGVESPRSLPRTANAIAARESLVGGLFTKGAPGLRVIASGPHLDTDANEEGLNRLLSHARKAHGLSVVDCGTATGPTERLVIEATTHLVWVLPATISGVRRGSRGLELFRCGRPMREVVVARHDAGGQPPPVGALATLAAARQAPLVLMPHVRDLCEGADPDAALAATAVTLEAIHGVVRR